MIELFHHHIYNLVSRCESVIGEFIPPRDNFLHNLPLLIPRHFTAIVQDVNALMHNSSLLVSYMFYR